MRECVLPAGTYYAFAGTHIHILSLRLGCILCLGYILEQGGGGGVQFAAEKSGVGAGGAHGRYRCERSRCQVSMMMSWEGGGREGEGGKGGKGVVVR